MVAPTLFFTDGVTTGGEDFFVGCGFHEDPDVESSVIGCRLSNEWGYHSVPEDYVTSVTMMAASGEVFALGRNGLVKRVGGGGRLTIKRISGKFKVEQIADVDKHGPLESIRGVGQSIFACGWGGQIYRREASGDWLKFDLGRNARKLNFLSIDGFAADDVYAVGMKGTIWNFDGNSWKPIDSPTNRDFNCVRCLSSGRLALGGAKGAMFIGTGDSLVPLEDDLIEGNCWSMAEFQGALYATMSDDRLIRIAKRQVEAVIIDSNAKRTTYRLSASKDALLSIGPFDIAMYNGKDWTQVICPENE